jgi:hypothetical protein
MLPSIFLNQREEPTVIWCNRSSILERLSDDDTRELRNATIRTALGTNDSVRHAGPMGYTAAQRLTASPTSTQRTGANCHPDAGWQLRLLRFILMN